MPVCGYTGECPCLQENPKTGVPDLQTEDWDRPVHVRNLAAQKGVSVNIMCLNRPQTIPQLWWVRKLSSSKLVPCAKEVGGHCEIFRGDGSSDWQLTLQWFGKNSLCNTINFFVNVFVSKNV